MRSGLNVAIDFEIGAASLGEYRPDLGNAPLTLGELVPGISG